MAKPKVGGETTLRFVKTKNTRRQKNAPGRPRKKRYRGQGKP